MFKKLKIRLNHKYPQNFILKHPFIGSMIYLLFCFIFTVLYRPLKTHASLGLSYPETMAIYLIASAASVYILVHLIKLIPLFSGLTEWTFRKEIFAAFILLSGAGVTFYFMGFLMEQPVDRWNIETFLDSCKYGFLIGIIPLSFFTLTNLRYLFAEDITQDFSNQMQIGIPGKEQKIHIVSKVKKEELSFFPHQFLYAESDGNYVAFYLTGELQTRKELIRNSMNEIERQLSGINYFLRVHRAYMVNVKKVESVKGNTLGYKLKLYDTDVEIMVSRQKVKPFDQLIGQFK